MTKALSIILLAAVMTSCTKGGNTIEVPDPSDAPSTKPLVTVVYDPDALETAQTMLGSDAPTCRKLLMVAEPCYGESVIRSLEGIKGVLGISGASAHEQSWADNWSTTTGWLSNRFTQNFITCLTADPYTTYRSLFLYCAAHTLGSHTKIVNASCFGNLATTSPSEFIIYK